MHQHLVSAQVWNHKHGKPAKKLLERVAAEQLVLVSTGANDWLNSSGTTEKVDGGYRITAKKAFASGGPAGALLMTSAPYQDPAEGWQVLHFPVPMNAQGVRVEDDWRTLGMRATGSNTVTLEKVFVPEEAVGMKRPRGRFHPFFGVVSAVALPIVMSVYLGVADAAAETARTRAKKRADEPVVPYLLGEMQNQLTTAELAVDGMIDLCNEWDFEATAEIASAAMVRKTIAAKACIATVEKALEAAGGTAYFRSGGIERHLRDVFAGQFHPLPEKKQQLFTGRLALGLDPVTDAT
jgi:alkylation response protein AidB-like acyl-CoA dehydrogenase